MKVTPLGARYTEWSRYYAFKVTGLSTASLKAFFTLDGARMEAPLYQLDVATDKYQIWVTAFPHLEYGRHGIEVASSDGRTLWKKSFSLRSFSLYNSISSRIRPDLTEPIQWIELSYTDQSAFIEPIGTYPYDEEHEVIRIRITYPKGVRGVELDPNDVLVNYRSPDAQVLECGLGDDEHHHIVMSFRFRKDAGSLIFAAPGGDGYLPWIFHLSPAYRSQMIQEFAAFAGDAAGDPRYPAWLAAQRVTDEQLALQRATHLDCEPLISIVVPIYHAPVGFLQECVESVIAQSYANWELIAVDADPEGTDAAAWLAQAAAQDPRIRVLPLSENLGIVGNTNAGIAVATGDYIAFLDQDDLLEPDALYEYARVINEQPEAGLIYCDEDSFTDGIESAFYPRFKPHFNPDALYAHNYVIHMIMARRAVLEKVGLSTPSVEGAQDFDLTLRLSEAAPVAHVPRVLYHWRHHQQSINYTANESKPYVTNAAIRALENHFERVGVRAQVKEGSRPGSHEIHYQVTENPQVSVIIPTKDHVDLLDACVTSLLAKAGWDNLEILVVENNSTDPTTFAYYDELLARDNRIKLLRYGGAFNYSKIINWSAAQAQGEYLLLLNNDTQALTDGCIREMLGYFQREEVGVVGPLLLFPDGLVQTAGIALMADGRLGFLNQNLTLATHGGYLASLECPRNCSAILGAAQMVPKALFDELGGYDEELAVTYNDVDFCWRVREVGKLVVYTPHAQLSHREFATRGRDSRDAERAAQTEREAALMRSRWATYFADGDPELNPECDQASPWFKLPST